MRGGPADGLLRVVHMFIESVHELTKPLAKNAKNQ
jgi:hypothetical protein